MARPKGSKNKSKSPPEVAEHKARLDAKQDAAAGSGAAAVATDKFDFSTPLEDTAAEVAAAPASNAPVVNPAAPATPVPAWLDLPIPFELVKKLVGDNLNLDAPFHPLCLEYPRMSAEDELLTLAADIKAKGQDALIKVLNKQIVDGQNRFWACLLAGIEPKFEVVTYTSDAKLSADIHTWNTVRRHLAKGQEALLTAEYQSKQPTATAKVQSPDTPKNKTVSARYVAYAKKVLDEGIPALVEAVRQGWLPPKVAVLMLKYTRPEQERRLAEAGGNIVAAVRRITKDKFGGTRSKQAQGSASGTITIPLIPDEYAKLKQLYELHIMDKNLQHDANFTLQRFSRRLFLTAMEKFEEKFTAKAPAA